MHSVDEHAEVRRVVGRQHAMAEVRDVARCAKGCGGGASAGNIAVDRRRDIHSTIALVSAAIVSAFPYSTMGSRLPCTRQHNAANQHLTHLECDVRADSLSGLGGIHAPVQLDHIILAGRKLLKGVMCVAGKHNLPR